MKTFLYSLIAIIVVIGCFATFPRKNIAIPQHKDPSVQTATVQTRMKLSTGTTEIEVAGIGKVKGTLVPGGLNGAITYTFSWTANKIKADPDFKSLSDLNLHWWFSSGDTFTASASGNAEGPQNTDNDSCTATSTARSWAAIPYASAAYCSGDTSMSN